MKIRINPDPFFVTGLPRTRSAWIAAFLSTGETVCYHDLLGKIDHLDSLKEHLVDGNHGDSDSGLILAPQKIIDLFPKSKWLVIVRKPAEAMSSLREFLHNGPWHQTLNNDGHLLRLYEAGREVLLDNKLVHWVEFGDLNRLDVIEDIWKHLLPDVEFNEERWQILNQLNVQVEQRKVSFMPRNLNILS